MYIFKDARVGELNLKFTQLSLKRKKKIAPCHYIDPFCMWGVSVTLCSQQKLGPSPHPHSVGKKSEKVDRDGWMFVRLDVPVFASVLGTSV